MWLFNLLLQYIWLFERPDKPNASSDYFIQYQYTILNNLYTNYHTLPNSSLGRAVVSQCQYQNEKDETYSPISM